FGEPSTSATQVPLLHRSQHLVDDVRQIVDGGGARAECLSVERCEHVPVLLVHQPSELRDLVSELAVLGRRERVEDAAPGGDRERRTTDLQYPPPAHRASAGALPLQSPPEGANASVRDDEQQHAGAIDLAEGIEVRTGLAGGEPSVELHLDEQRKAPPRLAGDVHEASGWLRVLSAVPDDLW